MPAAETAAPASRFQQVVAKYREDHTHPVNHVLHVFVGWPLVGASLLLLPFRPWWSLGLFVGGYAFMWFGHFVFERNLPTIFKHPTTPFVMAAAVVRQLAAGATRILTGRRPRPQ
jgi:hypothetical protein